MVAWFHYLTFHDPLIRRCRNWNEDIPLDTRGLDKENSPDIPNTYKAMSLGAQSLNEVTTFNIQSWDKASSLDIQRVRKVLSLYVWGIKQVVSLRTRRTTATSEGSADDRTTDRRLWIINV